MSFRERGQSILSVVIASALLVIVAISMMRIFSTFSKGSLQANSTFQIGQISRLFVASLQNATAWRNTYGEAVNGAVLGCVKNSTDCAAQVGNTSVIQIDDSSGPPVGPRALNLWTPQTQADGTKRFGFNPSGQVCTTFNGAPGQGDDICPYALSVIWTPLCPAAGVCLNPQSMVTGTWAYNPATVTRTIAFNTANYNFQTIVGNQSGNVLQKVATSDPGRVSAVAAMTSAMAVANELIITPISTTSRLLITCTFEAAVTGGIAPPYNTRAQFQIYEMTGAPTPVGPLIQVSVHLAAAGADVGAPGVVRALVPNAALTTRSFLLYEGTASMGASNSAALGIVCTVEELGS